MIERDVLDDIVGGFEHRDPADIADALTLSLEVIERLSPQSSAKLARAFYATTLRVIENRLLADKGVRGVVRYWDSFLGVHKEKIQNSLVDYFPDGIPEELLHHLVYLSGSQRPHSHPVAVSAETKVQVIKKALDQSPTCQLRCAYCGYRFSNNDLPEDSVLRERVLDLVQEEGVVLADYPNPSRNDDLFKPLKNSRGGWNTKLEFDHKIPRVAFGPNDPNNLTLSCTICNAAKSVYKQCGEGLPRDVAHSLALVSAVIQGKVPGGGVVTAAVYCIVNSPGLCERCGASRIDRELTYYLNEKDINKVCLPTPWDGKILCYPCRSEEMSRPSMS